MRHFLGGFGAGAAVVFVHWLFIPGLDETEEFLGMLVLAAELGTLMGLAAWGLIP